MIVFGIRHDADARGEWSRYVIDSVNILNEQLASEGKSFYYGEIDVRQQVIDGKYLCDMYGWVVDKADAAAFEPVWLADRDADLEQYPFAFVSWHADEDGKPRAIIDAD